MSTNYIQRNYQTTCKALSILSNMFDNIAIPLKPCYFYDILVERETKILKVKCVSTTCKASNGFYTANIRKSGANSTGTYSNQPFDSNNCDYIYVETPENCYLIPTDRIQSTRSISVNLFEEYVLLS